MLSFNEYYINTQGSILSEALINKHSTHIEELIFTDGKKGLEHAINGLQYIVDTIGKQPAVSTKIDGCVHCDTLVVTSKGPKRISELTNHDYVLTFDVKNNKYVYCNNTNPRITGNSKSWVKVNLNNRGSVLCTSDHQWLTNKKQWVEANRLKHKNVWCINKTNSMYIDNVQSLDQIYDQWDLTTINGNFVIIVNGDKLVIHNSPAVFMINSDKGFAVASKSIFNKNPKLNYTPQDVDNNHTGGLVDKLKASLRYLSKIVPSTKNKIWQGDLLYTKDELKTINKDGKTLLGFQPNTLLYTVEKDSELGKQISASMMGIAVHTQYKWDGKDPSTMEVEKFGISKDIFKDSKDVFVIDTISTLKASKKIQFSQQELQSITAALNQAKTLGNNVLWNIVDSELGGYLQTYINTFIRENVAMIEPKQRSERFFEWIEQQVEKQKQTKKTQKGKDNVDSKFAKVRSTKSEITTITTLFEIFDKLTEVKLLIINKLNALSQYGKFVVKSNGDMEAVGDEGFVITTTDAKGAKLVDRYSFSKNNFSKDIIKSWTHKS